MTEDEYWTILDDMRSQFGDLDTTDPHLHAAAVGMTSQLYRNTEAVEDAAHVAGPWTDEDMLRNNARATAVAREALISIRNGDNPEMALAEMQQCWLDMLPTDDARDLLVEATGSAAQHYAEIIERLGLGFMCTYLTRVWAYPHEWWGSLAWPGYVERYCTLTRPPPDPATFRERMLTAPWDLTAEQAEFVTDNRYSVSPPSNDD